MVDNIERQWTYFSMDGRLRVRWVRCGSQSVGQAGRLSSDCRTVAGERGLDRSSLEVTT
jgi:hypothetical protein